MKIELKNNFKKISNIKTCCKFLCECLGKIYKNATTIRKYKLRPLHDGPLLAQQYLKGNFLALFTKITAKSSSFNTD